MTAMERKETWKLNFVMWTDFSEASFTFKKILWVTSRKEENSHFLFHGKVLSFKISLNAKLELKNPVLKDSYDDNGKKTFW